MGVTDRGGGDNREEAFPYDCHAAGTRSGPADRAGPPRVRAGLSGQLIRSLRKQFDDEESKLLPQLRTACTPKELQTLGHSAELAKRVAPTRPHPAAPDRPPANLIIDPAVSIVDKVRDVLTDRKV